MSSAALHLVAAITMLIDHIGCYIFPGQLWWRIIGRIAFPIYALMIAEGFRHTRSRKKYFIRLGILALISQIPIIWLSLTMKVSLPLNVLFGFCAALFSLRIAQYGPLAYLVAIAAAVGVHLVGIDYGAMTVLLPVGFYVIQKLKPVHRGIGAALIVIAMVAFQLVVDPWEVTIFTLFAIPFVVSYNGEKGRFSTPKWLRYGFSPAHLLVIAIIVAIIRQ